MTSSALQWGGLPTNRLRRLVCTWACAALAAALVGPGTLWIAGAHARPAGPFTTMAPDEVTASASALAQGIPVEALSDRTERSQVFANPNGSFTYRVSTAAQRVRNADGSWSDIDPTLSARSDGTVRPAASPAGLILSGGGPGPMLTVSRGPATLSLAWPLGTLPAPTVIGPTATYASVLPGVDLGLTATSDGVTEALVVRSAQAAANPDLASLTFPVSASGLTLEADGSGGASARDAGGSVLFDVPPPRLWDSAGAGSSSRAPGAGARVAPMPMAVTSTGLTVSPGSSLLTAPGTVYPVYVDPEVTVHGPGSWLDVGRDNNGGSWGDWEPSDARIGASCQDDGFGNCVNSTRFEYRSFFNFPVPHQIWGAAQVSANLFTTETWSWTCSVKTTAELWRTDTASKGATWPGPAERQWQDGQTVAYGNTCPAHGVSFTADGAAKSAAANSWGQVTLELRAYITDVNDWNVDSWKRFQVTSGSTPYLQITYDFAPDKPTNLTTLDGTRSVGCSSSTWISTSAPSLQADIGEPDNQNLRGNFHYARSSGSPSGSPSTSFHAPGTFTQAISGLTDGSYTWNVAGEDDAGLTGPTSSNCSFGVDTSRPATPTITSTNYVSGQGTNPVGTVGSFTFSDPGNTDPADGVNDVVGYRYGFTDAPLNFVAAASEGGSATVQISPVWLGSQTLYVLAVDRAGNLSPDDSTNPPAEFGVVTIRPANNPTPLLAEWKLDEGSGTTAHDATGNGHTATLGAQAGWGAGRTTGTSALSLTGAPDSEAFTAAQLPPVDNTGSFTVSVWAKLTPGCANTPSSCNFYDPVSMDGVFQSSFALEYLDQTWCQPGAGDGTHGCWGFNMSASDTSNATSTTVEAATTVTFGTWVHLTGVFDQVHQTIAIYVNGQPDSVLGPVSGIQPWAGMAMGPLRIGRVLYNSGAFNWWPGEVSDVCVFWGALDNTQIANVFNNGCANAGQP